MFEGSASLLLATASYLAPSNVIIAVLTCVVFVLAVLVAALRRGARFQLGPLVIEPDAPQEPPDSGDITSPGFLSVHATDETAPFDLAEINQAMRASETLRAIEALRAAEAKLAFESFAKASSKDTSDVETIRMQVCPLCILFEVTGESPKCHVVPSDMRLVKMGRSLESQIQCSQPSVSQNHFQLVVEPRGTAGKWGGYTVSIEDCGSRNGTWVNGNRVEGEAVELNDGDIIEAASMRFLFYFVLRGDA